MVEMVGHAVEFRTCGSFDKQQLVLPGIDSLCKDFVVGFLFMYGLQLAFQQPSGRIEPLYPDTEVGCQQVERVSLAYVRRLV